MQEEESNVTYRVALNSSMRMSSSLRFSVLGDPTKQLGKTSHALVTADIEQHALSPKPLKIKLDGKLLMEDQNMKTSLVLESETG